MDCHQSALQLARMHMHNKINNTFSVAMIECFTGDVHYRRFGLSLSSSEREKIKQ